MATSKILVTINKGVAILCDNYCIGVDIKFQQNDTFIILTDGNIDGDEVMQMFGRGVRYGGVYFGEIYMNGNPLQQKSLFQD